MRLILASASPRRRELLTAAGIPFTAQSTDIPENPTSGEEPRAFAERLAREKASVIAAGNPEDAVLGADTIVVVDGLILGKPADASDAERMMLNGIVQHELYHAGQIALLRKAARR